MDIMEYISKRRFFCLIIFINLINSSLSYLAFKYAYAFKMTNKDIFVIHQLGVTISDETFTISKGRVLTFSESEQIKTDQSLSKINSVIADKYIICLINERIHIFDSIGNFLKKDDYIITDLNPDYYTLEYVGSNGNYIFFVIGFISNYKLYLFGYRYQTVENSIQRFAYLANTNSFIIYSLVYIVLHKIDLVLISLM